MVFGEITTKAKVDYEAIVRDTCKNIGYDDAEKGLDYQSNKAYGQSFLQNYFYCYSFLFSFFDHNVTLNRQNDLKKVWFWISKRYSTQITNLDFFGRSFSWV